MSLNHPDHREYLRFTGPQRIEKAVQTLKGLLHGISVDDHLSAQEIAEVMNWCREHKSLAARAPFNELIPALDRILKDGTIDPEELQDLLWLCKNLSTEGEYFDHITLSIQTLHGIMHGILADGKITDEEIRGLSQWIDEHDFLKGRYPYDELDSLLLAILKDGKVDDGERQMLNEFFDDFVSYSFSKRVANEASRVKAGEVKKLSVSGICANCPEISFEGRTFTFTGSSVKAKRSDIGDHVVRRGGKFAPAVSEKTDFLVIGSEGNPCWAFACYGRKVEKAIELRKQGHSIVIIHESDFWDAVEDQG